MYTPTFNPGDKVKHIGRGVTSALTIGKVYTVVGTIPPYTADNGYRFPEYVNVINDFGEVSSGLYTYRFEKVTEG